MCREMIIFLLRHYFTFIIICATPIMTRPRAGLSRCAHAAHATPPGLPAMQRPPTHSGRCRLIYARPRGRLFAPMMPMAHDDAESQGQHGLELYLRATTGDIASMQAFIISCHTITMPIAYRYFQSRQQLIISSSIKCVDRPLLATFSL